jgi:hypothetical protein
MQIHNLNSIRFARWSLYYPRYPLSVGIVSPIQIPSSTLAMKLSFIFALFTCVCGIFAGGIRGAYERMFIWYAYQAHTKRKLKAF